MITLNFWLQILLEGNCCRISCKSHEESPKVSSHDGVLDLGGTHRMAKGDGPALQSSSTGASLDNSGQKTIQTERTEKRGKVSLRRGV